MSASGRFPSRTTLFGLTAVYLIADLVVFHGPLRHQVDLLIPGSAAAIARDKSRGVVARVFNQAIHRSQLDRAVRERLWLEGKSTASATSAELQSALTNALNDLIDHEILRVKLSTAEPTPPASQADLDARTRRLANRFENEAALKSAMTDEGIPDESALRNRLAAQIRQEEFVELQIAPHIEVTEEEARVWYSENLHHLGRPERIQARHMFIPTLETPPEDAKQKLEAALASLMENNKDFATLAREISLDPATRESGGELGWMTRERLPADLAGPMFSLETGKPALLRSRLGWHLVEVTARKAAEVRTFNEAKPEILSALEALKREKAVAALRESLRNEAQAGIVIHHDVLEIPTVPPLPPGGSAH